MAQNYALFLFRTVFPSALSLSQYDKQALCRIKLFATTTTFSTKAISIKIVLGDTSAFFVPSTPNHSLLFNASCILLLHLLTNNSHPRAHCKPHLSRCFYLPGVTVLQPIAPTGPYALYSHFYTLQHRCAFAQFTDTCNAAGSYVPYSHATAPQLHVSYHFSHSWPIYAAFTVLHLAIQVCIWVVHWYLQCSRPICTIFTHAIAQPHISIITFHTAGPHALYSHFYTLQYKCISAQSTGTCNAAWPIYAVLTSAIASQPHIPTITFTQLVHMHHIHIRHSFQSHKSLSSQLYQYYYHPLGTPSQQKSSLISEPANAVLQHFFSPVSLFLDNWRGHQTSSSSYARLGWAIYMSCTFFFLLSDVILRI